MAASTFEKVDLLPAVVSRSRQSESGVQVIGNGVKAHADFSRVVPIQHAVVKTPVLGSLWGGFDSAAVLVKQLLEGPTRRLAHLENVRLSLAVVAREGRIHWPVDAPHVLDELWVTGENRLVIQFKEVLTWKGNEGDAGGT